MSNPRYCIGIKGVTHRNQTSLKRARENPHRLKNHQHVCFIGISETHPFREHAQNLPSIILKNYPIPAGSLVADIRI